MICSPGCKGGGDLSALSAGVSRPVSIPSDAPGEDQAKRYVVLIRLRIGAVEVPAGTASDSERIWSYLDEEPIDAARAANLGRNGFRVGLGRQGSWPDVAAVLKGLTGRVVDMKDSLAQPGNPVQVVLQRGQPRQTIFVFHPDRTVSGADYPPGENLLAIACTVDEDDTSTVLLTGLPQIRSKSQRTKVVRGGPGVNVVTRPEVFSFEPLSFQLAVPQGDFVVIGPGSASRRAGSAARHFLVKTREGMQFETVLVLMPQAVLAEAK